VDIDYILKNLYNFFEDFEKEITIDPQKNLFDEEKQKEILGDLNNKTTKIPIIKKNDSVELSVALQGLFTKYTEVLDLKKKNITILGPSGTSKTFTIQQLAQKEYIINIICQGGSIGDSIPDEKDNSFLILYENLKNNSENLEEMNNIIYWYIICRILYLWIILNKAKKENKILTSVDFYILQTNGYSTIIKNLFNNIISSKLAKLGVSDFAIISKDIIKKIKELGVKKLSFAIDEAGAANLLLSNCFLSIKGNNKTRALLTGLLTAINCINELYEHLVICGTHLGLSDYENIISVLGKKDDIFVYYTFPSDIEKQIKLLKYFFNLEEIEIDKLKKYFSTKPRLIAAAVTLIKNSKNLKKNEILKNSLLESYKKIKENLEKRFLKIFSDSYQKDSQKIYKNAIKELICISYFFDNYNEFYEIETNCSDNVDLMNLGIASQSKDLYGKTMLTLIRDPLILEVCESVFTKIFKENNPILQIMFERFKKTLFIHDFDCTDKGNDFELVLISNMVDKKFQGKNFSELSFIKKNCKNNIPNWLNNIQFNCNSFGKKKGDNIDFLKKNINFFLKPDNDMHPDGIYVTQQIVNNLKKYYFLIFCCKISCNLISSKTKKKNLYSGNMSLFYYNNYTTKSPNINKNAITKQKKFFEEFPYNEIGGVVRILFELDSGDSLKDPIITTLSIGEENNKVQQLIITINKNNLKSFVNEKNIVKTLISLYEIKKNSLKRKRESNSKNSKNSKNSNQNSNQNLNQNSNQNLYKFFLDDNLDKEEKEEEKEEEEEEEEDDDKDDNYVYKKEKDDEDEDEDGDYEDEEVLDNKKIKFK
jgi:hypothetical protein